MEKADCRLGDDVIFSVSKPWEMHSGLCHFVQLLPYYVLQAYLLHSCAAVLTVIWPHPSVSHRCWTNISQ